MRRTTEPLRLGRRAYGARSRRRHTLGRMIPDGASPATARTTAPGRRGLPLAVALCLGLLASAFAADPTAPLRADLRHDPAALAFRDAFVAGDVAWDEVLARARSEGEVSWYHWGGSEDLNTWIERIVVPELAQLGVRVRSVRVPDTRDAVDVILADAASARGLGRGSVDLVWINGDNFRALDAADLLFGPFADAVPAGARYNLDEADPAAAINLQDLGTPTLRRSIPWFSGQYVCYVDTARLGVADAPRTYAELEALARARPGRFTYVRPPDYIGTAFVQQALVEGHPEGASAFLEDASSLPVAEVAQRLEGAFAMFRRLEPFLLGGGGVDGERGSPVYPPTAAAWERLLANGEVDMACEDNVFHATLAVESGRLPESVRTVVFPAGAMRVNKSFLAIPANAPNPAAALVLADHLSSLASHLSKLELIGFPLALDLETLSPAERAAVDAVSPDLRGLSYDELAANAVPDMHVSWVRIVDRLWERWIAQASDATWDEVVASVLALP